MLHFSALSPSDVLTSTLTWVKLNSVNRSKPPGWSYYFLITAWWRVVVSLPSRLIFLITWRIKLLAALNSS